LLKVIDFKNTEFYAINYPNRVIDTDFNQYSPLHPNIPYLCPHLGQGYRSNK